MLTWQRAILPYNVSDRFWQLTHFAVSAYAFKVWYVSHINGYSRNIQTFAIHGVLQNLTAFEVDKIVLWITQWISSATSVTQTQR